MNRGLLLIALLFVVTAPASAAEYLALRFPPAKGPAIYLRFDKNTLRTADSAKGLEHADRITALVNGTKTWTNRGGRKTAMYPFPEVSVPIQVAGFERVTAAPILMRTTTGGLEDTTAFIYVRFLKHDAGGVSWTYSMEALVSDSPFLGGEKPSHDIEAPSIVDIVSPVDPEFGVQTKLNEAEKKVGIGVSIMQGETPVKGVWRGKALAPVHLAVYDRAGRVVHAHDGDASTFTSGWSGPSYSVRIAKPGRYTVKATMEAPGQPFTAEATFTIPDSWGGGGA